MKKRIKGKVDLIKLAGKARRDEEIKKYGKLLSLRPSIAMESKKIYKRKKFRYEDL